MSVKRTVLITGASTGIGAAYAEQGPFNRQLLAGRPGWYAVSTDDRTIDPDLECFMAKRMRARTIEISSAISR
jgi:hypothetical protein